MKQESNRVGINAAILYIEKKQHPTLDLPILLAIGFGLTGLFILLLVR